MIDHLPQDPFMLMSAINTLLRDHEFESLESLCAYYDADLDEVCQRLAAMGFDFDQAQQQFK